MSKSEKIWVRTSVDGDICVLLWAPQNSRAGHIFRYGECTQRVNAGGGGGANSC